MGSFCEVCDDYFVTSLGLSAYSYNKRAVGGLCVTHTAIPQNMTLHRANI